MRLLLESSNVNGHHDDRNIISHDALDVTNLTQHKEVIAKEQADNHFSDEALMAAYASGNVKSFEQLYARHKDPLLRYFIRQVSSRAIAEELFQETWQSLIKNSINYKSSAKFTTYLYTIAHSRLVDFYRKSGKAQFESMDDEDEVQQHQADKTTQPEFQVNAAELKSQLLAALEQLSSEQKEVFLLKFEAGMSVPEIAKVLNQNPEAVKSRLRYCVANLKGFFNQQDLESKS
ncbi:sigma-70 family RNA polymerase sigma factor [Kangiella sp. HZ709]|uniref:sigma-70 family RNA polymerase sigma factor n=1 Tax=Kangiella sp. HZ709 TaxID=2666328 RepID=UPI0012B041DF|nr:sigma-70 family RNA polymerase sigma factor [Kangiella sp. HZ709]MRX28182.1 sigma-70 family RNA polymerase sigma factor [Kangiella sp. HZ709]